MILFQGYTGELINERAVTMNVCYKGCQKLLFRFSSLFTFFWVRLEKNFKFLFYVEILWQSIVFIFSFAHVYLGKKLGSYPEDLILLNSPNLHPPPNKNHKLKVNTSFTKQLVKHFFFTFLNRSYLRSLFLKENCLFCYFFTIFT